MEFAQVKLKPGKIYILRNPLYQDAIIKIGRTSDLSEIRAEKLSSSTGIPYPFEVMYEEDVVDCVLAERLIHQKLGTYRVQANREFFQLPIKLAVRTVFEICLRVNLITTQEKSRVVIWMNGNNSSCISQLKELLLPVRGGESSVFIAYKNDKAECHIRLSDAFLIHCTPELLTQLQRQHWVDDVCFHVPIEQA
jgi:hypothetical protein